MSTLILTYADVVRYCDDLSSSIHRLNPSLIVGIARGGLIPAVHLSHNLGVPLEVLLWQTRDGDKQIVNPRIDEVIQKNECVVFVDDINDSGKTFSSIIDVYRSGSANGKPGVVVTACIIEKMYSSFECDFTGARTYSKEWVCFPWENN